MIIMCKELENLSYLFIIKPKDTFIKKVLRYHNWSLDSRYTCFQMELFNRIFVILEQKVDQS